jgi:hypothetical protein
VTTAAPISFGAKALQILRTVAPTLAIGALGPFGPIAAAAIHLALGTDPTAPASAEAALLNATPEQLQKLKDGDNAFKLQMKTLGVQEEQLAYADTASARAREIAVKDNTPKILAYLVITLVAVAEGSMLFFGQPKNIDGVVLGRILGTLDAALIMVLGYYFGSSAGSAKKDSTISDLAKEP